MLSSLSKRVDHQSPPLSLIHGENKCMGIHLGWKCNKTHPWIGLINMNILLIQYMKDPIVTIETVVPHTLSSTFGNTLT